MSRALLCLRPLLCRPHRSSLEMESCPAVFVDSVRDTWETMNPRSEAKSRAQRASVTSEEREKTMRRSRQHSQPRWHGALTHPLLHMVHLTTLLPTAVQTTQRALAAETIGILPGASAVGIINGATGWSVGDGMSNASSPIIPASKRPSKPSPSELPKFIFCFNAQAT